MKQVKEGAPFFLGEHTCPSCGAVHEIERKDVAESAVLMIGQFSAALVCPSCGYSIHIPRPNSPALNQALEILQRTKK